ncbi:unnamed protein product [Bursaphelenchus okinawaensis]|uniref:UBC core domain-containing protein n=1 Tax=Bursaphelenchus okinawaensis TaxID=465554 RepID=A0A811K7Y3_9BILA|nr:unnamed protein product [Bursaphelenchus okinawaensis]CAG9093620.1 unnamed protein product [Bursaphelenchus okinawaensis]
MKPAASENQSATSNLVAQAKAIGQKRLVKELEHFKKHFLVVTKQVQILSSDSKVWALLIAPQDPPYSEGKFKISLEFGPEYPFKPPRISFLTPIYHPNVNAKGDVCLTLLAIENWKPAVTLATVISSLISLINNPEPERGLSLEIVAEYVNKHDQFLQKAKEKSAEAKG